MDSRSRYTGSRPTLTFVRRRGCVLNCFERWTRYPPTSQRGRGSRQNRSSPDTSTSPWDRARSRQSPHAGGCTRVHRRARECKGAGGCRRGEADTLFPWLRCASAHAMSHAGQAGNRSQQLRFLLQETATQGGCGGHIRCTPHSLKTCVLEPRPEQLIAVSRYDLTDLTEKQPATARRARP